MNSDRYCPRCGETMRTWDELSDEEREVASRLPGSADYKAKQRRALHQWCTRCWYESTGDVAQA